MIHGIQLWSGPRQETDLDMEGFGEAETGRRRMWRASILKEDQVPAAPMPANHT
jgi:hypothetical protein